MEPKAQKAADDSDKEEDYWCANDQQKHKASGWPLRAWLRKPVQLAECGNLSREQVTINLPALSKILANGFCMALEQLVLVISSRECVGFVTLRRAEDHFQFRL
jgi:hypothetical protein